MNLSSSHNAIELRGVSFSYKKETPILNIPEFKVARGEKIFVYGSSGSGKTTLLGLLSGVLTPQKGSIRLLDREYSNLSSSERDFFRGTHIGYIFQQFNLIPYLSAKGNILLPLEMGSRRGSPGRLK